MIIKIERGGQLERVGEIKILKEIEIYVEDDSIIFYINENSLSYLSLQEALKIRNALNESIKKICKV